MKRTVECPCGIRIDGDDEDELVERVQSHLADRHPGRDYTRDEILFVAF